MLKQLIIGSALVIAAPALASAYDKSDDHGPVRPKAFKPEGKNEPKGNAYGHHQIPGAPGIGHYQHGQGHGYGHGDNDDHHGHGASPC